MVSERVQDWDRKLYSYLCDHRSRRFEYGVRDCVLFAADWILIATGDDLAAQVRGTYSGPLGARRALRSLGGETVGDVVTVHLGAPRKTVLKAQRGDLAAIPDLTGFSDLALGIVAGGDVFFLNDEFGLVTRPLSGVEKVWEV